MRSEEGAVAAEAAIVMSAFLVLMFGMIEFAQVFWTWNAMMLAIEEGGRYAMVYNATAYPSGPPPSSCSATPATLANCAVAKANAVLAAYPSPVTVSCPAASNTVCVSCTVGCTGTPATMTLQGTFTLNLIPSGLLPYSPSVTSSVTVPLN
jgi:Flp pilus assembly protein TadG